MPTPSSGRPRTAPCTGLIVLALLLAAAAPVAGLLPYDPAVLTGESCLAPDYEGAGCAHFRRLVRSSAPEEAGEPYPLLAVEARFLLLSSNELAGGAGAAGDAPRAVRRRFSVERPCAAPSRHRPDRPCPRGAGRKPIRPR